MTEYSHTSALDYGISVIHSNQLEELRDVVEFWLKEHPLAPLENEIFLVQSNGMGQWLKQCLAQNSAFGVAAAINMQLPSLFIWNVYRAVLGQQIPKEQLLSKSPLTWRLYRLLPDLIVQPEFDSLARFLTDDDNCRKRYQLAEKLADLYDQYQVYRSDWIADWGNGLDVLKKSQREDLSIPEQHRWQAALWRAILVDVEESAKAYASRASVHHLFMNRFDELACRPEGIPRRLIVFGLSSLPQQSLEVLAKLGKFCQIILFVLNPCRHYWADIIEDKELSKTERRRQTYKSGMTRLLAPEELHLHSQPLLAAWGKQGRDYIRLLDQFDETASYANWHWPDNKIDLFQDYGETGKRSLLQHLQQSILDLEPIPDEPIILPEIDGSLVFHVAHSPQREVEILHDQLLDRFNTADKKGTRLLPRDVIVMVPDINKYAPHIIAVFGQIKSDDPRYIPFSLADQQQRGQNALLVAIEALVNLPESRFSVSELLTLLEAPALRQRFDIEETAIPVLQQWIEESGIRWGLNARQRAQVVEQLPNDLSANTWQAGLNRMLLGYAVGAGDAFNEIEPYEDIGGLDTKWLGSLAHLFELLEQYSTQLTLDKSFSDWQQTLNALLEDFFVASNEDDKKTLENLSRLLASWGDYCEQAGLTGTDLLPLNVVREAWLSAVDEPTLQQRFLSGRVNFCTLMPMRAIPFRVICLLGMNDGDFPRTHLAQSFDLMSLRGQYRPGDRSRRHDDQYLFLEALLSTREQLYISWVGRNIRDNSALPPSVLISQLRDYLELGWRLSDNTISLLPALTLEHALQPFSHHYVLHHRDPRLFTFAKEWFEESTPIVHVAALSTENEQKILTLSIESLARFLVAPVKAFCNQTLKFGFDDDSVISEDDEPFFLTGLENYEFTTDLLNDLKITNPGNLNAFFDHQYASLVAKGKLPLGPFSDVAFNNLRLTTEQAWNRYQLVLGNWPTSLLPQAIELVFKVNNSNTIQLTGNVNNCFQHSDGIQMGLLDVTPQMLVSKDRSICYHKILLYWIQHLVGCAHDQPLLTLLIAADTVIEIPVIPKEVAYEYLNVLVNAWYQGLQSPLPIACRTAFAYLSANSENAIAAAQSQYEGDEWKDGEMHYDAYLGRFFPGFSNLAQADTTHGFEFWVEALYRPVFDQVKQHDAE